MTSLSERSPSHRYYAAMHGRWRGRISTVLTDPGALAAAKMSALDRLTWRLTVATERWLGPPWLETSVDYQSGGPTQNRVIHTTRVRQLGLPAMWGREIITLDRDGCRFTLRGAHRFAWFPLLPRAVSGDGMVPETAGGASYLFAVLGTTMTQTTKREGLDVLVVTQETPFSRAEVRLQRIAAR